MIWSLKLFKPSRTFKNKRVAVIGAADSLFHEKNGKYIDGFDIVIRINKAPYSWKEEDREFVGSKFTYLYHSFFENKFSGGGPIDWQYFDKLGIEKVINPNYSKKGLQTHLNYYRRNLYKRKTYLLSRKNYTYLIQKLEGFVPTVGYSALISVLQSKCAEVYITGFTFFKTPYTSNYRDELEDMEANKRHIAAQGIHNPDLEFESFKNELKLSRCKHVRLDKTLQNLLEKEPVL